MSSYLVKAKGWRYDFTLAGQRYTMGFYDTKREANQAEADRRDDIQGEAENRKEELTVPPHEETPIDMVFLDLVNRRLDHVKAYNCERYYTDHKYMAKGWVERWGPLNCSEITQDMVEQFLLERRRTSPNIANKELRLLRAMFNQGKKRKWILINPTDDVDFFPRGESVKYVPPLEHVEWVIAVAEADDQDYLFCITDSMARVSEINRLKWSDVHLGERYVSLFTRKKRGGNLTERKVPMTHRLHDILSRRFRERDQKKPWVFWHRYWSRKKSEWVEGPYGYRKVLMRKLCEIARVPAFGFHAVRHCGASLMEKGGVPVGSIQRILGHESRKTTEIYLHSIGDAEREAIVVFEREATRIHTPIHTPIDRPWIN